jgi:hypothetical protein
MPVQTRRAHNLRAASPVAPAPHSGLFSSRLTSPAFSSLGSPNIYTPRPSNARTSNISASYSAPPRPYFNDSGYGSSPVRARPTPAASSTLRQELASLRQDFDAYTAASDTKLASLRQDFSAYCAASETKLASMHQATAAAIVALKQTVDRLNRHMPWLAPTDVTALKEMLWRHQAMVRQASRYTASLKWRETAGTYSQVAALNTKARLHQEAMDAIHLRQYDPDVHKPAAAQQAAFAAFNRPPTAKSRPPTPSRLLHMQRAL